MAWECRLHFGAKRFDPLDKRATVCVVAPFIATLHISITGVV